MLVKHIPFNQNILQVALAEIDSEKCLLLFPTHKSKQEAQKLYWNKWDFFDHKFLTMDEWKESLFISSLPILKEEKRTLALYQSLRADNKDFFKIRSYHQFIDFSQNFFSFWEEINEEQVDYSDIVKILNHKQTAGNWQLNTLNQMQNIKLNYQNFLKDIGFSDQLFVRQQNELIQQNYDKIIVVNQFYFTNFEKRIIKIFEDKITILTQIPPECFKTEQLQIKPDFNAEHIKQFLYKNVQVFTSENETNMIADLAIELAKVEKAEIIDFQFNRQPYAHLLSSEFFSKSNDIDFSHTRFYRFWQHVLEISSSRIQEGNPFLLSLQSVFKLVSTDDIFAYFLPKRSGRENFRTFLSQLIEKDFKFIDLELIKQKKSEFLPLVSAIFDLLQDIDKINSIDDLINYISSQLNLNLLLNDLQAKSDLVEVLFSALADFQSIESIGLVQNWKNTFPANLQTNLVKLLLDYLKFKKIKLNKSKSKTRFNLNSLQNTRNLQYEYLFVLNVVEGVLPDRKHTQFLLSENQRRELGLKTYEDITLRDKYYFYRLLCNCQNAKVFTRFNLEENVEISSFLEELKLYDLIIDNPVTDKSKIHEKLFDSLLNPSAYILPQKYVLSDDFFTFPFKQADFSNHKISLSFYKWQKLQNNPFEFYLEFVLKLKNRKVEISNDFDSKLIGIIAHEIINLVFKKLVDVYHSNQFQHNFIFNTKLYVRQAIEHYIKHSINFLYISPHNFSDRYFQNIFLLILADGIENFFYRLHNDLHLSEKPITILPETDKNLERDFVRIKDLDICLKGRPDLRLHTSDQKYIFDFKTGNSDYARIKRYNQQLQFYEEIYYLIDSPDSSDEIDSYLFFVEQKDLKKLSKKSDLKEEIIKAVKKILSEGFGLADKKYAYEELEITRRDLRKIPEVKS